MAFESSARVFVKSISGEGPEKRVSDSVNAKSPKWSSDNVIYYKSESDEGPVLMRVTVSAKESESQPLGLDDLEFGDPEFVLNLPISDDHMEITPDGKSLLVIEFYGRGETSAVIHKIRNFFTELDEKEPEK